MINRIVNWTQAAALCQTVYQTDLTTITNPESHASAIHDCRLFCNTKLPPCGCWTGAHRRANEASWHWIDGAPLSRYGFYSDGTANDTGAPWHLSGANVTLHDNAYIAYIPIDNAWKWSDRDDSASLYPLCDSTNMDIVQTNTTDSNMDIVQTNTTTNMDIVQTNTTDSIYNMGKPVEWSTDIYLALLVIIFGLLCIVGTIMFYKHKTDKQQTDVYKISTKVDANNHKPGVVALAKPKANMTKVLSVSKEYSSDSPKNVCVNMKGHNANTMQVMSDINSVNIEDDVLQIMQWLSDQVKLPQYYNNFIENGYEKLEFIQDISSKEELHDIKITKKGHQVRLFKQIRLLQNASDPRPREVTILLSETKHEDMELEEEHAGRPNRYKKKHKNHQHLSMTYLSSLHITEDWKEEHGRVRSDGSLSVSSIAAKGQHPQYRTDGHGSDVNVEFLEDSGKVTAGFMVEDSSSDDSRRGAQFVTPLSPM